MLHGSSQKRDDEIEPRKGPFAYIRSGATGHIMVSQKEPEPGYRQAVLNAYISEGPGADYCIKLSSIYNHDVIAKIVAGIPAKIQASEMRKT